MISAFGVTAMELCGLGGLEARWLGGREAGRLGGSEDRVFRSNNQEHFYLAGGAGARGDRRGVMEGQIEFTTRFALGAEDAEGSSLVAIGDVILQAISK